ncbi:MAG TPA: antibiotic biosynthesis monooxygenase [Sphingomonas sp.]|nr:antibiotic biosynthesis monooxygenase [Sphingomonas sp.]
MIVLVRFEVGGEDADRFLARASRQAADSLALEPACRRFDVATHPDDIRQILLYEIYDSAADFEAHLRTEHFLQFDRDVAEMVETKTVEIWNGPRV